MGFRWTGFSAKGAKQLAKNIALTPVAPLYAAGGAINKATGGKTTTYSVYTAASGKARRPTYSTATQALSGYQGAAPKQGTWRAPVLNPATPRFAGEAAAVVIREAVAPTADAVSRGLFGVKLSTLAWTAAGVGVAIVAGPPLIDRALKA